jgi:hypothetical protein
VGEGRRSGEMSRYTVEEAAAVLGMTTGAARDGLRPITCRHSARGCRPGYRRHTR